jgi:hypothetical protein
MFVANIDNTDLQINISDTTAHLTRQSLKELLTVALSMGLFVLFFSGCGHQPSEMDAGTCVRPSSDTSTHAEIRGALLATRFGSMEELAKVVQIEYEQGPFPLDSMAPASKWVRLRHCSGGKEVVSYLEEGIDQGDMRNVKNYGDFTDKLAFLYNSPYSVANRDDLGAIYLLFRKKNAVFGVDDQTFFQLAQSMSKRINTLGLAVVNVRDTTEKGYVNTFNHMTAQAFITSCFSEELADFSADVHERSDHPELIAGKFTAQQYVDLKEGPVDNYVDIVNNEWGQELGKELKKKYQINPSTAWTPQLLANYLNDVLRYYSWAFQIGFEPFKADDVEVVKFAYKLDQTMRFQARI